MYRTALRARPLATGLVRPAARRFASSTVDKPRSWKSLTARLGLAVGAVYYFNSSPVFAEEPAGRTVAAPASFDDKDLPTVDSVIDEKRKQYQARLKAKTEAAQTAEASKPAASASSQDPSEAAPQSTVTAGLEEEAGQQGAFNPETGEINWDCPCLGGMADGPCGEQFKTAFSCFVYSDEEPKGMDCIEKFQGMQECFREYPEVYGAELADEEEAGREDQAEAGVAAAGMEGKSVEKGAARPEGEIEGVKEATTEGKKE